MELQEDICTVGIDMGGTKIAAAPFINGELISSDLLKEPTPQTSSEDILNIMASMVEKLKAKHEISAIGISTAGAVNSKGEISGGCGNIPVWRGTKAKAELEKRVGLPVTVENDANCSAFAEYKAGAARGYDPILLVIVGTGIGGGIVYDDKIWQGANFFGGEIGHIKISDQGETPCTCGAIDCWEAFASGPAVEKLAKKTFLEDIPALTGLGISSIDELNNKKLMEFANAGNETAKKVMDIWHKYLALGMSSVINVFDPACVVTSGGMAQFINYEKLNELVKEQLVDALKPHVNIRPGAFANNSGMIGAAVLANLNLSNTFSIA